MPSLIVRTVISLGHGSHVICLPSSWLRFHQIKSGDQLEVIADGDEITIRKLKGNHRDGQGKE
jgi:bifunctional DNA-binding transcriptional regulator/antitoxin component of YhaV-PrlF toxin-antitoxin module